jgi:hypothetical protein
MYLDTIFMPFSKAMVRPFDDNGARRAAARSGGSPCRSEAGADMMSQ